MAEKAMSEFVSRSCELQKQRDQAYDKADKVKGRNRIGTLSFIVILHRPCVGARCQRRPRRCGPQRSPAGACCVSVDWSRV